MSAAAPNAEYVENADGSILSWYCSACTRELGGIEPRSCPACGSSAIAWEWWNLHADSSGIDPTTHRRAELFAYQNGDLTPIGAPA